MHAKVLHSKYYFTMMYYLEFHFLEGKTKAQENEIPL